MIPVNGTAKVRLDVTSAQGIAKFDNIRFGYGREVVTSSYDSSNNYVVSTINQLNKTVSYGKDAYGQATSVTSPTGEVIRYAYDGQERLRTVTDNAQNMTTYGLDANGNVLSVNTQAPTGTIYNQSSFVYDDKNNLKEEKNAANSIVSSYAYDANGRLTQKTNASGSTVSLEYGPLGLLKTLRLSSNETYGFSYDLEGRRKQATVSKTPTGPIIHTFDYDYDKVGNLISSIEKDNSGAFIGSITKPAGDMYSKTDQLLGFKLKYLSNPDVPYAFLYSPNNLVEKVSAAGKDTLFKYDEGSKLKLQTNPNGVEDRFEYNEGNQLIGTSTIKPGSTNTKITNKYEYDDDGRLKSITRDGSENPMTKYVYNNGSNKVSGQISARYTRTPEGKLLSVSIYTATGIKDYYYHYNAHGDVVAVTDLNGAVYRQYAYDPYGNVISVKDKDGVAIDMSTDDFNHAYTYAGYRYDKEIGLYFLNARYYNAGIGRFLTKDKVLGNDANPKSLNRYAYAEGDPINNTDPTGTSVISGLGALLLAPEVGFIAVGFVIVTGLYVTYKVGSYLYDSFSGISNVSQLQSGDEVDRLPNTGPPNGYLDEKHPKEAGKIKGRRYYDGTGGKAKDIHLDHTEKKPGSHPWPHAHEWIGNKRKQFGNKEWRPATPEDLNGIPKSKFPSRYRILP